MANETVVLKRGPSASLPAAKVPGQILVEIDTGKMYVDDSESVRVPIAGNDPTKVPLAGGTMTGPLKLPSVQTTGAQDAVHYSYVNALMNQNMSDITDQLEIINSKIDSLPGNMNYDDGAINNNTSTSVEVDDGNMD